MSLVRLLSITTATLLLAALTGCVAFDHSPQALSRWKEFLLFLKPTPFNLSDPQFGVDLGFYLFRLPGLVAAYQWLTFALALCLVATAAVYLLYRGIEYGERGLFLSERARRHLLILLAALLAVKAGGYYLDAFELLYSDHGAAYGASGLAML